MRDILTSGSLRGAVLWTGLVFAAFLGTEGLLFRSGAYLDFVEPDSSLGQVESKMEWLEAAAPVPKDVLVVGDSRIAEGFSPLVAREATNKRLHFWNFGVPGSSPRVWYYELRDADPDRKRFAAIVLAMPEYSDQDQISDEADRLIDINFLTGRLGYADCYDFATSFRTPANQWRMFLGCMLPGLALRSDLQTFLSGMKERAHRHRDWFSNGVGYLDGYGGKPEDLRGLSISASGEIQFPPGLKDWQHDSIVATLKPQPAPQNGTTTTYRREWLGAILDLYRESSTRIIFLQLPHTPIHLPPSPAPARFLKEALRQPHVTAMPADSFADLEKPELFADGLHLNKVARPEFSVRVAKFVEGELSRP